MDVKTTFLNRVIEEEVYVEHPQGFELLGQETHVCQLRRAHYGLKQAPRAWYLILTCSRWVSLLTPNPMDGCAYVFLYII